MSEVQTKIPDAKQPAAIKSIPDARIYREENRAAANSLPPPEGVVDRSKNGLPTDAEVLAARNRQAPGTASPKTELTPIEEVVEEVVTEEEPVIETIDQSKNEGAAKAKEEISAEDSLGLEGVDSAEDRELLESLGFGKKKEPELKKDDKGNPIVEVPQSAVKDTKAIEAEFEEKYLPYKTAAQEYELVKADPIVKAMIEFRKSGKVDVLEFAKEVGFVNVEGMTNDQVLDHEYRTAGLSPEDAQIEKDAFDAMTPLQKKKHIDSVKNEMIQTRNEKLKTFTAGNEESQKLQNIAVQRGLAELKDTLPKMEGKKYKSLLITSEMAKKIDQFVRTSPTPVLNEKGQIIDYDIKKSVQRAVSELFFDEAIKSAVELGRVLGADKALEARRRVDKKTTTSSAIPSTAKTEKDVFQESSDKIWKNRGVQPTKK